MNSSQFLRLALDGVVLAYVAGALIVIAFEFGAAVPGVPLTVGLAASLAFATLEAAVVASALRIFKTILS